MTRWHDYYSQDMQQMFHDLEDVDHEEMANTTLTVAEDIVLSILHDHGPSIFRSAAGISACERLSRGGYIVCEGETKALTAKGLRYLKTHYTKPM
jgi:hypothetical protein